MQVPKYVRWHYKLEPTQILYVTVSILGVWRPAQSFLLRISKDGRIVIPKLTITLFKDGKPNLDGYVADVRLTLPKDIIASACMDRAVEYWIASSMSEFLQ